MTLLHIYIQIPKIYLYKKDFLEMKVYHPMLDMAYGRLRTPAPTMAVTLWKVEYHHLAVLDDVIGSHSSIALSSSVLWSPSTSLEAIPHTQHKNGKSRFLSSKSSFKNEQIAMLSKFNMY